LPNNTVASEQAPNIHKLLQSQLAFNYALPISARGAKRFANAKNWALNSAVHKEARTSYRVLRVVFVISVLGSGCSSLRPPAEDRAVWAQQQEQAKPQENVPENLLYYLVDGLGTALAH
jgi:hypothetical protein